MKLTIETDRPLDRDELAKVVRSVVSGDRRLRKAADDRDKEPRVLEYEALQGSVDANRATVERVRRRMVEKLELALKGA